MSLATSRSDRFGFTALLALAALLAAFLITGLDDGNVETATQVSGFADLPPAQAEPVSTTEPIEMPAPTPTPAPSVAPVAAPALDQPDAEVDENADDATSDDATSDDAATDDAASTDGAAADEGTAGDSGSAAAAPAAEAASTDGAASNSQPAAAQEEVPNPQLPEGAEETVPNPQLPEDAEETVPNPQLPEGAEETVPNPQPATQPVSAPANVPADAPAGGTFTHTLTATVSQPTLHTSAGGPTFMPTFNGTALPPVNPTVFGNPLVYRVLAGAPGDAWAKVYVPARPNGTTAWVQTSQFNWGSSNRMLQINVSNNTVTVFEGSNVLVTTAAVTGKSSSPTPRANGWVEEIMAGPSAAYGPRLISLGIFSDALNSFGGSVPKVALHGTNNPGLMGQYASNGCIRVPNDIINQIAGLLPVGSKVIITG